MRRVSKLFLLVLGFAAGLLSGSFIRLGFEILRGRPTSVGGEALILPLIVLLLCFGYCLGKEVKVQRQFHRTYKRGYQEGYIKGVENMTEEVRAEFFPEERIMVISTKCKMGL